MEFLTLFLLIVIFLFFLFAYKKFFFKIFISYLFQRGQRGGSAPPGGNVANPAPANDRHYPMTMFEEPDFEVLTPVQARVLLIGLDPRLIQLLYAGFRFCQTRSQIAETLEIGQLGEDDLRRAVLAAMVRGLRLDTLILLVLRSRE